MKRARFVPRNRPSPGSKPSGRDTLLAAPAPVGTTVSVFSSGERTSAHRPSGERSIPRPSPRNCGGAPLVSLSSVCPEGPYVERSTKRPSADNVGGPPLLSAHDNERWLGVPSPRKTTSIQNNS